MLNVPCRWTPQSDERTLDVPGIFNDYSLNLLDWSGADNILALGLQKSVHLWNPRSTTELVSADDYDNGTVTSVKWAPDGLHVAVGFNNAEVQLWDTTTSKLVRTLRGGHEARVGSLDWNNNILTTGSMDIKIINNDVRLREHVIETYRCHNQESNLLASGGGEDHCIKFWNTKTGKCLETVDMGSQVSSLLWNRHERELLNSHGNEHTLLEYPSMAKLKTLRGHSSRVLQMSVSPDGYQVASVGADEKMPIWQVFDTPKLVKPTRNKETGPFASFARIR